MKLFYRFKFPALFFLCFLFVNNTLAQPFTLKENINPTELKFHPFSPSNIEDGKGDGKINITEINQINDTLYFFARNISIYSPIYVSVDAEVPDPKINVGIYKMNWLDANISGKTDGKGHWDARFKTEMDFGIMVVPEETPIKYTLLAWVGNEANFEMPTTFFEDEENKGGGLNKMTLMYIVIGVLALALILMFLKNKKRSK